MMTRRQQLFLMHHRRGHRWYPSFAIVNHSDLCIRVGCVCICVPVYVCMYVCMYVYKRV